MSMIGIGSGRLLRARQGSGEASSSNPVFAPPSTSGLIFGLDANAITATDQDELDAITNPYGAGGTWVPVVSTTGVLYESGGWNGGPNLFFYNAQNRAMMIPTTTFGAGSSQPWTVAILYRPGSGTTTSTIWSCGELNAGTQRWFGGRTSASRFLDATWSALGSGATRNNSVLSEHEREPFPQINIWVCTGSLISIYARSISLTMSSTAFAPLNQAPTHFAVGASIDAGAPTLTGQMFLKNFLAYDRALDAGEVTALGVALATHGQIPEWGRTIEQAAA